MPKLVSTEDVRKCFKCGYDAFEICEKHFNDSYSSMNIEICPINKLGG